ncbi:MAG: YlmC/YmxH family sporulation protein [Christensenellales bacterium]
MIETSFCELRSKCVINVLDGKNLGHISDIVLEICSGRILGLIVPVSKGFMTLFKGGEDLFIPYHNVCKIGQDVILVELNFTEYRNFKTSTFSDVSTANTKIESNAITPDAYKSGGGGNDKI